MKLQLMVPHSTGTYEMFRNLLEHSPDDTPFPDYPECLRSIYADNFVKDFPAETFYSMDSFMTAAVIADECSVTTMRSENGHTLWQREARLKSCQTISDSFQCVAASTLLIRQRKIERAGARLTQMPKKRGRPKKVKKKQLHCENQGATQVAPASGHHDKGWTQDHRLRHLRERQL